MPNVKDKKQSPVVETPKEEIALPGFINQMPAMNQGEQLPAFVKPAWMSAPVVMFAHPASLTFYPRIVAAHPGIATGAPVLIHPNNAPPVKLDPFKYMLIAAKQFFCSVDGQGNPVQCVVEPDDAHEKEYIDSLILVFTSDGIIPATCQWRTTKCQAIHGAKDELEFITQNPDEWAKRSAEHQFASQMPHPYARFTCTVQMQGKTAKGSGLPMQLASAIINPATPGDWKVLQAAFTDNEQVKKYLHDCTEAYKLRLRDIAAKLV